MKKILILFFSIINPLLSIEEIKDRAQKTTYYVHEICKPKSVNELQKFVLTAKTPIAIAGSRFSQGGQTVSDRGSVINMKYLNQVMALDVEKQSITVQAGITWREIQQFIDSYDLSILVMQSYNDFSVGGSLAVNAHGRELSHGQLIDTVQSLKIMLADGNIITANRNENYELFRAIIGSYGKLGIIIEATLQLTKNEKVERHIQWLKAKDYPTYFFDSIKSDPTALLHNANLYPNDFSHVLCITWHETNKPLTINKHLQTNQPFYPKMIFFEQILRRISHSKAIRPYFERWQLSSADVVMRNYEMSYSVNTLRQPIHFPTVSILQEYFIPIECFDQFIEVLQKLTKEYNINIINASIRHIPAQTESLLTYAPTDSFAFVLYINKWNTINGTRYQEIWTRELIDASLNLGGKYYLPYEFLASKEQFNRAYPNIALYKELTQKYDPENIFNNLFWTTYGY
ncbi:MAG: FAD-binding oxidoreductase [Candidatus Babeliales bacterium]